MANQLIPFNRPSFVGNELDCVTDAIQRGQLSGDGHYTKLCNQQIITKTGCSAALLTHSCTAALEMAAILSDLGPGDEVIMPSFTFVSTANAVVLRGATPVFVDIDAETLNICPRRVEMAVTPKTKAIIAVHYAGFPADMDALADIAKSNNLILIEDAAQAFGSTYKGRQAGTLSDLAAFSFHETKNIISGEGGALTLNHERLVQRAEIIREKGTNRSSFIRGQVDKYTWVDLGSSFLPGELIAAFLHSQLEMEPRIRQKRLSLFDRYMKAFAPLAEAEKVRLPVVPDHTEGNGHMFYLRMQSAEKRNSLMAHLKENNIVAPFHYIPLHSSPAGKKFGRFDQELTVTDDVSRCLLRLPLFYTLGSEIERVIDAVNLYFARNA